MTRPPRHLPRLACTTRPHRLLAMLVCAGLTSLGGIAIPAWSADATAPKPAQPTPTVSAIATASASASASAKPAAGKHEHKAAIEARYQAERKACLDGRSGQDRATCLKEAGAARSEALRSRLDNGENRAQLRANALARCKVQPASERASCETMARGQGIESGSVASGGVIKELVTRSVGAAPAPVQAGAASAAAPASSSTGEKSRP